MQAHRSARPRMAALHLIAAVAGVFAMFLVAAPAKADQEAENYVQERANEVMDVINNTSYSPSEKEDRIADIVDQYIDVERIANFTLGKYRGQLTDSQRETYVDAFRDYLINYYVTQLSQFKGVTLKVTGSQDSSSKGSLVTSTATAESGDPTEIDWQVASGPAIIDIRIEGISMAQNLREQVVSELDQNGGDISAAIDLLNELANTG